MEEQLATLNVKDVPEALYRKLRRRAARERRSVAQELITILTQALEEPVALSVLELKGLGKEAWAGVDAVQHVDQERRSWGD